MARVIKNAIFYAVGNFTSKAVNFLLLPLYTSYLTPEEFGLVTSVQVLSGVLLILFTLGIERSIYRLFFDYGDDSRQRDFLGTVAISIASTSLLFCCFLFLFNDQVSGIFKSIEFYPYFAYGILTAFFMTYEMVPMIALQVKEKGKDYLHLSLIILAFRVFPVLWFVVYLNEGALGMLKGAMIGNALSLICLVPITIKHVNLRFDFTIFRTTIRYSLPFIPMILSAWIVNMSDRIFIERFFSTKEVGIYSLGYKLGEAVNFLSISILMAYNPFYFKMANSTNQVQGKAILFQVNNAVVIVVMYLSFVVAFFSKEIILLLFNDEFKDAYKIIPIISFSFFFTQLISLQSLSFYQTKSTLTIMNIVIIAAFINIVFNFFLISRYSFYGAAVSSALTQIIFFLIVYFMSKRHYFIKYDWVIIVPSLVVCIIFGIISVLYIPVDPLWTALKLLLVAFFGIFLYSKNKFLVKNFN